ITTSIAPDIVIMDEMIASGDAQFIDKAKRRLHELIGKSNILALASHDLSLIRNLCNKVVWLEHGLIKRLSHAASVTPAYGESYPSRNTMISGIDNDFLTSAPQARWASH